MTKKNYTQITNNELLKTILNIGLSPNKINSYLKTHNPELLLELISRTHFLDEFYVNKRVPMPARLFCIEHNRNSIPKCSCPGCDNLVEWRSGKHDFAYYCSQECKKKDALTVWERAKTTNIKLHGVVHKMCLKETQQKVIETNRLRFGCDYPLQSDSIKQQFRTFFIETYGVENPSQLDSVKEQKKKTNMDNWGVDNYAKTIECQKRIHKKYTNPKYPDMTFGSSWEFLVYDFLLEKHIEFEYQPSISVLYEYGGSKHTYHPDFLIGDQVFEVKGDNFFRINESTGIEEMFCPYRNEDWSDEKYEWMCGIYEAKHQCMLANNVIILRQTQIKNLSVDMFIHN